MKKLALACLCAAIIGFPTTARAGQTNAGVALYVLNGTHSEGASGQANVDGAIAPLLFVDHKEKRFEFRAEGIPPIGSAQVHSSAGFGLKSVALTYLGASADYRLTADTEIGIGETLYNQQSTYVYPMQQEIDASRLVGLQYQLVQALHHTASSTLDLHVGYNPHMTANLFQNNHFTYVNGSTFDTSIQAPESGTQTDIIARNTVQRRNTTIEYGIRYLNLVMRFPNGQLADRNSIFAPFFGIGTRIGK